MTKEPLTGGDGIPHKRGEKLPESLFLLSPHHKAFLRRKNTWFPPSKSELDGERTTLILLLITTPFLCVIIGTGEFQNFVESGLWIIPLFVILVLIYSVTQWVGGWMQRSTLTKEGQVFIGQVASAQGEWKIRNRVNFYFVTVNYRVRLPDDTVLHGQEMAMSMDMVGKPLPERGTPVAVLYVNEYTKRLL